LIGCALAIVYGIPTAWYPFGSDQGIHWYLGHALLHGEMPYASGISGKPPLIFVVHAIAEILFGNHQSSIRILEILAMPGFGWVIAQAARRRLDAARDGEVGAAALLLSAATFTYQDYWNTAHPEFGMTLSLLGAFAVAVHAAVPRRRALLVGALCMVSFLFKYPGAAVAIPIAGYCGFRALYTDEVPDDAPLARFPEKARWLALVREAVWFLAGAFVVFVVCLLPFVMTGTVREMFEVCVQMTENYASGVAFPLTWYRPMFAVRFQGSMFVTMSVLFALGIGRTIRLKNWRELAFGGSLFLLALTSIASVVLQKRLFTYHWLATYPFFVAIALWGVRQLVAALRWPRVASSALLAAALVFCLGAFFYRPLFITRVPNTYREHVERWWRVMRGELTTEALMMSYFRVAQADKVGDLIRASEVVLERAQPGDTLCLTCFISPVYQFTGLRCTTRHAIGSFVLLGPKTWRSEYGRDLRERPARFMVSIHTYPRRNAELRKLGYRQIARYGTVLVFERMEPAP
jgi:hypothetical protein